MPEIPNQRKNKIKPKSSKQNTEIPQEIPIETPAPADENVDIIETPAQVNENVDIIETPAPADENVDVIETPAPADENVDVIETPAPADENVDIIETPAPADENVDIIETPAQVNENVDIIETPAQVNENVDIIETPAPADENVDVIETPKDMPFEAEDIITSKSLPVMPELAESSQGNLVETPQDMPSETPQDILPEQAEVISSRPQNTDEMTSNTSSQSNVSKQSLVTQQSGAENSNTPAQSNVVHPAQSNVVHPAQSNVVHPAQSNVAHPAQSNVAHPAQSNVVHPAQSNVAHPAQSNVVQSTQTAQPSVAQQTATQPNTVPANAENEQAPANPFEEELMELKESIGKALPFQLHISFGTETLGRPTFDKDHIVIGRDEECDVVVDNLGTSRNHAEIIRVGRFYLLRDLQSKTGTFIHGKKIEEYALNDGDEIFLAKHTLVFHKLTSSARWKEAQNKKQVPSSGQKMMHTMAVDFRGVSQHKEAVMAVLAVQGTNEHYEIEKYGTFLGKGKTDDIKISGLFVGVHHVAIIRERQGFFLYHLGIFRPPLVNNTAMAVSQLKHGDSIEIGDSKFVFHIMHN